MTPSAEKRLKNLLANKAKKLEKIKKAKGIRITKKKVKKIDEDGIGTGMYTRDQKIEAMVLLRETDINVRKAAKELAIRWNKKVSEDTLKRWFDKCYQQLIFEYDNSRRALAVIKPEVVESIDTYIKNKKRDIEKKNIELREKILEEIEARLPSYLQSDVRALGYVLEILYKTLPEGQQVEIDTKPKKTLSEILVELSNGIKTKKTEDNE